MRFSSRLSLGICSVLIAIGSHGCQKNEPEPNYAQQPQEPYPPQQQYPQQPAPQQTAPPQQQPPQQPADACSTPGPAQPIDPSAAAAVQPLLSQLAAQELPGSKPLGPVLTGNFQPCQTLKVEAQLQPGKCYVLVGAGAPPVAEVNVKLAGVMALPGSSPVFAQDSDTGVQAVIGRKPNCYKNPLPVAVPVKIVLEVQAGAGLAAAQLYEK